MAALGGDVVIPFAAYEKIAFVNSLQSRDHPEQGRFAAAGRAK